MRHKPFYPSGAACTRWAAFLAVSLGTGILQASEAAGKAAHGAGGHEPPAVLLPPNVWAIVSFLIVLAVLVKKVLPPILQVMDRRATTIREGLEAARKAREEAVAMAQRHAEEARKSREEALAIVEEGKADARKVRESITADAKREADEILGRAKRDIELAKQSAVDELHRRAVDLAFDMAGRLVKKSLDPAEHQQLIQERINNLPSA